MVRGRRPLGFAAGWTRGCARACAWVWASAQAWTRDASRTRSAARTRSPAGTPRPRRLPRPGRIRPQRPGIRPRRTRRRSSAHGVT